MRPRSTASFTTSSMRSRVSITRLSGRMTPRVIASRTSATDLPEKSSRSAAPPAAEPAFWAVPAALPARWRPLVERVCAALRPLDARDPDARELDERELDPDERELEPVERDDEPERALEERELEPDDRDEPERALDERDDEPDELERDEPEPDA